MSRIWFYQHEGREMGPLSAESLRELVAKGELAADVLVWKEGMTDWVALDLLSDFHFTDSDPADSNVGDQPDTTKLAVFRPVSRVAKITCALLKLQMGIYALIAFISVSAIWELSSDDMLDPIYAWATIALVGAHLATVVAFLIWTVRSAKNARVIAPEIMKMPPGWCAGFYFIPIAFWWKPYQGMRQICDAHLRNEPEARRSLPMEAWWLCWILASLSDGLFGGMNAEVDGFPESGLLLMGFSSLKYILSANYLLLIIEAVTRKQMETDSLAI